MDSDDFGPLMSAKDHQGILDSQNELEVLKQKEKTMLERFEAAEAEFGSQRAKFMELFRQKEDDLQKVHDQLTECGRKLDQQHQKMKLLTSELEDMKIVAAISEANKMEEVERIQRKYQDDMASLQHIIQEATAEAEQASAKRYENEVSKLVTEREKLYLELQDFKSKANRDRDGILSVITKSLQKRVGRDEVSRDEEEENLESSMKKAQEDVEMLRSIVTPFEEEISGLRKQLKQYKDRLIFMEEKVESLTTTAKSSPLDSCDRCSKKELKISAMKESEQKIHDQLQTIQHHLENERDARKKLDAYRMELENGLNTVSANARTQILTVNTKLSDSEHFLESMKRQFIESLNCLKEQMMTMSSYREDLQKEMTRLQDENDELIGKHSRRAEELQDEIISLPNSIEEIQLMVLKYREEAITAKVGQEHISTRLQRKIDQLRMQIQQRAETEEKLTWEINQLREQLAIQNSINAELEPRSRAAEARQHDAGATELKLRHVIEDQQKQIQELANSKNKLENNIQHLSSKIETLRTDLANSEAVQKDFVKFSQSLQIQLEKIRSAEDHVRWQHEEDVDECEGCKTLFTGKSKQHCWHCGHVFCKDCLQKSVPSGPNDRLSPVCIVCHTLLVKDAVPYFSTDTLQTPP